MNSVRAGLRAGWGVGHRSPLPTAPRWTTPKLHRNNSGMHSPLATRLVPILFGTLIAALGMIPEARAQIQAPSQAQDDPALVSHLKSRFEGDRTGACVVAAVIEGTEVRRARYCAGPQAPRSLADDTAFEIGSVSKTMTAFLVAELVEQGTWSLDDPIARHLPAGAEVPRQGERQITVRDLLTHTAGLPALPPGMRITRPDNPYADLSEADLLQALARTTLNGPIGSRAAYSNFGAMVLSLAVARAHGQDLETVLQKRLFTPLGMRDSHIARAPVGTRLAQGHTPAAQPTSAWTITTNLAGVGMVKSSLNDMVRYAQAQLGLADPSIRKAMQRTQQPLVQGFGMNWLVQQVEGRTLVSHEGGTGGFSSLVSLDPAANRAVIILADTGLADLGGLGDVAAPLMGLNRPVGKPRVQQPIPDSAAVALAGQWNLGGLPMTIRQEGSRLIAQAQGQSAFELFMDSRGDFYPIVVSAVLRPLWRDGRIDAFRWTQGGGTVQASRQP